MTVFYVQRNARPERVCGYVDTLMELCLLCSTNRKRAYHRKWCLPIIRRCTEADDCLKKYRGGVPKRQPGLQNSSAVLAWVAAKTRKTIPVLLATNFPVLKSTRQFDIFACFFATVCAIILIAERCSCERVFRACTRQLEDDSKKWAGLTPFFGVQFL